MQRAIIAPAGKDRNSVIPTSPRKTYFSSKRITTYSSHHYILRCSKWIITTLVSVILLADTLIPIFNLIKSLSTDSTRIIDDETNADESTKIIFFKLNYRDIYGFYLAAGILLAFAVSSIYPDGDVIAELIYKTKTIQKKDTEMKSIHKVTPLVSNKFDFKKYSSTMTIISSNVYHLFFSRQWVLPMIYISFYLVLLWQAHMCLQCEYTPHDVSLMLTGGDIIDNCKCISLIWMYFGLSAITFTFQYIVWSGWRKRHNGIASYHYTHKKKSFKCCTIASQRTCSLFVSSILHYFHWIALLIVILAASMFPVLQLLIMNITESTRSLLWLSVLFYSLSLGFNAFVYRQQLAMASFRRTIKKSNLKRENIIKIDTSVITGTATISSSPGVIITATNRSGKNATQVSAVTLNTTTADDNNDVHNKTLNKIRSRRKSSRLFTKRFLSVEDISYKMDSLKTTLFKEFGFGIFHVILLYSKLFEMIFQYKYLFSIQPYVFTMEWSSNIVVVTTSMVIVLVLCGFPSMRHKAWSYNLLMLTEILSDVLFLLYFQQSLKYQNLPIVSVYEKSPFISQGGQASVRVFGIMSIAMSSSVLKNGLFTNVSSFITMNRLSCIVIALTKTLCDSDKDETQKEVERNFFRPITTTGSSTVMTATKDKAIPNKEAENITNPRLRRTKYCFTSVIPIILSLMGIIACCNLIFLSLQPFIHNDAQFCTDNHWGSDYAKWCKEPNYYPNGFDGPRGCNCIQVEPPRCNNNNNNNNNNSNIITIPIDIGDRFRSATVFTSHSSCILTGALPSSIGNMTELQSVQLSHNDLNGTIPHQLLQLKDLKYLSLDHNHFIGDIALSLGTASMSSIQILNLQHNNLTGFVVDVGDNNNNNNKTTVEIDKASELNLLYLNDNNLSGTLPRDLFGQYTRLRHLWLHNNYNLSGINEKEISLLSNTLEHAQLQRNSFNFTSLSETSFDDFKKLIYVDYRYNTILNSSNSTANNT